MAATSASLLTSAAAAKALPPLALFAPQRRSQALEHSGG
jgi:hypothetical protein